MIRKVEDFDRRLRLLEDLIENILMDERMVHIGGPVFEALISGYGSQGRYDDALRVFEQINGLVDGPCLRAVLLACGKATPPRWEEALAVLHSSDIVEGTSGPAKMDQISLGNAIIACSKANEFDEALNLLQLYGILKDDRYDARFSCVIVVQGCPDILPSFA
jgi:pentatricopeptide repeat protein